MSRYDAYLLRVWRSTARAGPQGVGRLEHLEHGELGRFDDVEALLAYLRGVVGKGLGRGPDGQRREGGKE